MLILKCTQKAAKELGLKRGALPQIAGDDNPTLLGDWFVNSLRWGHSKLLLFANAALPHQKPYFKLTAKLV